MTMQLLLLTLVGTASTRGPVSPRAKILQTTVAGLAATLTLATGATAAAVSAPTTKFSKRFDSLDDAAAFIRNKCTAILAASTNTGLALYRGENGLPPGAAVVLASEGDLLNPATYSQNSKAAGIAAADYFKELNNAVANGKVIRSGHIATSSQRDASVWGPCYSVWPVDSGLVYASFAKFRTLFSDEWATPQGAPPGAGPFFWRNPPAFANFLANNLRVNSGLESALSSQHEVCFSADEYVAIPIALEGRLFRLLSIEPFSPSVKPLRIAGGEVDDVPRQLSRTRFIVY